MTDAGSRKDIRAAEKAERLEARAERDVITALCSHAAGREWLWAQLERAHVFQTILPTDYGAMAFAEGERNSGLRLLDQITTHAPDQFVTMMREANDRRTRSRSEQRPGDPADDDSDYRRSPDDPYGADDGTEPEPSTD